MMRAALIVMLCGAAGLASAQIAGTGSHPGAPFRPNNWGMDLSGGSGTGVDPPVNPCTGTIDLSEGCTTALALLSGG